MTAPPALAIVSAAAMLGAVVAGPAFADEAPITGSATVIEGDVLEVAGARFRLFGIDAPEIDQSCEWLKAGAIPCGEIARTALMDLTAGAVVTCRAKARAPSGEAIAICFAGLTDLGWNMVHTGWALAARDVTDDYVAKEAEARSGRRGLWGGGVRPAVDLARAKGARPQGRTGGAARGLCPGRRRGRRRMPGLPRHRRPAVRAARGTRRARRGNARVHLRNAGRAFILHARNAA